MKRILITGANSYIGTSFEEWVSKYPDLYQVDSISLRDDDWRVKTFKGYDVVLHTVGIAHVDSNPNPKMESLYYRINRDLTIETARKAKEDGVKQFIFMSSIIVYGESSRINEVKIIDAKTIPNPTNFYGKSKLQAEEGIKSLENNEFKVAIIRTPMVYGKGAKGNYPKLSKVAKLLPIFPDIDNQRSMIYIDNLCEFLRLIIHNYDGGVYFPQNKEYVKTSDLVRLIAELHGKRIVLTKKFNPLISVIGSKISLINKVFGSLVYDSNLSNYKDDYCISDFKESIYKTEL